MSQRPFSWPSRSGPPAGRECLSFPGPQSGASLKEPESKGRKGRQDQSPALFRGVNAASAKVKSRNDLGTQPQRVLPGEATRRKHPSASFTNNLASPSAPSEPCPHPHGRPLPLLHAAQDETGSDQEYRLSQL